MTDYAIPTQGSNDGTWGTDYANHIGNHAAPSTGFLYNILQNSADTDTTLDLGNTAADQVILTVGGETMLTITEDGTQDKIVFGDQGDIDFVVDCGTANALLVTGSTGNVSLVNDLTVTGDITGDLTGNLTPNGDIDGQGYYAVNLQNFPENIAGGPGYWFDGSDDYVNISADADLSPGTGDFSVLSIFRNTGNDGALNYLAAGYDTGNYLALAVETDGTIEWKLRDGTNPISIYSTTDVGADDKNHVVVGVSDKDSVTGHKIYCDGIEESSGDPTSVGSIDLSTSNFAIGIWADGLSNSPFAGQISRTALFNLALSAAEVKALSNGAPIPYKYIGASQTEQTSGTLIIGKAYRLKDWITDDDFTNVGAGSNADGVEFVATGTTPTTWTNSSKVVQIGCVLNLNPDGIGHNQWIDTSGNNLHGDVSGSIPTNLPANHIEKYADLSLTGNSSFTLPQGYKITSIIVHETAGNALTGGLDVGLTTNGVDIVSGEAIGSNAEVVCTLVESGTIGGSFTSADDTIYFSDGDDDGNWNSASLEVTVSMQRIDL